MHTRRTSRRSVLAAFCGLLVGSATIDGDGVAGASEDPSGTDPGRSGATADGPTIDDPTERWWRDGTATSVPTLADGAAFVATEAGELLSLDTADGEERWSLPVSEGIEGAPATDGDAVYLAVGEELVAVDAGTGDERWRYALDGPATSSPVVADGTVYVSDGRTHAVSTDGERRFRVDGTAPAATDGAVFVVDDGVRARSANDGEERWHADPAPGIVAVSATGRAVLAWSETEAFVLDPDTGEERRSIWGDGIEGVATDGETVTVGSRSGLFSDGPDGGWEVIKEPRFRGPLLAGDRVYATNTHEGGRRAPALYAFEAETGVERWSLSNVDAHGLAVGDGSLLVSTADGIGAFGDATEGEDEGDGSDDPEDQEGDDDESDPTGPDDGSPEGKVTDDGDESEDGEPGEDGEGDEAGDGGDDDTGTGDEVEDDASSGHENGDDGGSRSEDDGTEEGEESVAPGDGERDDGSGLANEPSPTESGTESRDIDSIASAVEEQPGFGILAGLGGIGAAAYALYTRVERGDRDCE
ncbi:outer membrane protein assembly factor BamB family protein [Natronorarus salvus]|uniref:outer membrane protein assembly factor BamB family protein n=1 Tax=Natronorarus salvus TaxID=3117733 RepID=UPI002F26B259